MEKLGENTPSGPAHRSEIERERDLLVSVEKLISGSSFDAC